MSIFYIYIIYILDLSFSFTHMHTHTHTHIYTFSFVGCFFLINRRHPLLAQSAGAVEYTDCISAEE